MVIYVIGKKTYYKTQFLIEKKMYNKTQFLIEKKIYCETWLSNWQKNVL